VALPGGAGGELLAFVASPVNVEFAMGVGIGALYVRRGRTPLLRVRPGPLLVAVAATAEFAIAAAFDLFRSLVHTSILALVSAAVVCFALGARREGRLGELGELLGNASYSIYLTHSVFTLGMYDVWAKVAPRSPVYLVEVVGSILAITGGVLVHFFVEKPVVRLARGLLASRRAEAEAKPGAVT
jgi:exopolysaccharide production protein ExoZ